MNEKLKYYSYGILTSVILLLLVVSIVVGYKTKLQSDLEKQLKQEDKDKAVSFTAKYVYTDEHNISIYLPESNMNIDCNFGDWGCSYHYIDVNGNDLYSEDFITENSTQYVYCRCRTDE